MDLKTTDNPIAKNKRKIKGQQTMIHQALCRKSKIWKREPY
jgi:hypothetical protein